MGFGEEKEAHTGVPSVFLTWNCYFQLLFSYRFDYFCSPHWHVSPLVRYREIIYLYVCVWVCVCGDQRFLGQCPHYLSGLTSMIKNRCSWAFALPTISACIK
jgi:hypothetical protein